MQHILIVNPLPKKRSGKKRGAKVSARKKRRGPRHMTAKQLKFFGPRVKRNPKPKRRKASRRRASYARNPIGPLPSFRAKSRRRSRSIMGRASHFIPETLMGASVGAGGALALDLAWGVLPIPAELKTGMLAPLARIAGAVALGMLGHHLVSKRFGEEVMVGAVTVTTFDLVKGFMAANMPGVPLSAFVDGTGMGLLPAYVSEQDTIDAHLAAFVE